jgi:autotransporter-associated beta strand protein
MCRTNTWQVRFCALVLCAQVLFGPQSASAVTIPWVPVGNPGNANDPLTGGFYGGVPYNYSIDKYDVTNSQYAEFLNTKDATGANTLGLWNSSMANAYGGINFNAGNANGSKYSLIAGHENHPVHSVTWYDAIRFANWLNNGQGSGNTESGAYTLLGGTPTPSNGLSITRNAGATVFLPSENEWYKAAYYDPRTTAQGGPPSDSHYWFYGTSSNATPTSSGPTALPNHANYAHVVNNLSDVGAYTGTTSPYGAFDMAGNVWQWNEALISGSFRSGRGGTWDGLESDLPSSVRLSGRPAVEGLDIGFRVATILEPPASIWTGASSTSWADSGNWTGAVPGATSGTTSTDTAYFRQTAANSPLVVDAARNVQNITFDTANVNSLVIGTTGGPSLLLTAGGTVQTTSTVVNSQTINAPLVLGGDYTFNSSASTPSATLHFGGAITPSASNGTTTLALTGSNAGANTISGVLADNGAGLLSVVKDGPGIWILSGADSYSGGTTVIAGTLRFNVTSGSPTVAAGATATVDAGATLELAGSVSALSSGASRVNAINNSSAPGILVSGTNQQVGNIDGSGTTQVNAGSDLTTNHIIQGALVIDGTSKNQGTVTIDASDASGNPLASLAVAAIPSAAEKLPGTVIGDSINGDPVAVSSIALNLSAGAGLATVPEPSGLVLIAVGGLALSSAAYSRRRLRIVD